MTPAENRRPVRSWRPGLLTLAAQLAVAVACGGPDLDELPPPHEMPVTLPERVPIPDGGGEDGGGGASEGGGRAPHADASAEPELVAACPYPPAAVGFSWKTEILSRSSRPYSSAVSALPTGVIFALHGSNGSASLLTQKRVEWSSFFRDAVARRYALVVLDSAVTNPREWYVATSNVTANPDLANIVEVVDKLIQAKSITSSTPIYLVGVGQGGEAAGYFASALRTAGKPVRAVAAYAAGVAATYASTAYAVPTTFAISGADPLVNGVTVAANVAAMKARGVDAAVFTLPEGRVCNGRFTRIPGISGAASRLIFDGLVAGGALRPDGTVTFVSTDAVVWGTFLPPQGIPAAYTSHAERIAEQLRVVGADNAFYGDRNAATLDFFDAHR